MSDKVEIVVRVCSSFEEIQKKKANRFPTAQLVCSHMSTAMACVRGWFAETVPLRLLSDKMQIV